VNSEISFDSMMNLSTSVSHVLPPRTLLFPGKAMPEIRLQGLPPVITQCLGFFRNDFVLSIPHSSGDAIYLK
jgi:hypothetical protein